MPTPVVPYRIPDWANPANASVLDSWAQKAIRTLGGLAGAADPVSQVMGLAATPIDVPMANLAEGLGAKTLKAYHGSPHELVPVTRVVDHGAGVASAKGPETWFTVGHLNDAAAAQLNDMYKGGTGHVERGYMPASVLSLTQQQTDEFGNRIASSSTEAVKRFWQPIASAP